jgi:hypothetical protein
MISDVLSDAAAQIRRYLDTQPTVYSPVEPRIRALLAQMDDVREKLDGWLPDDPTGPFANASEAVERCYQEATRSVTYITLPHDEPKKP